MKLKKQPFVCPFKTGRIFCTHKDNPKIIKNGKRKRCIYTVADCPYLQYIKEGKNVIGKIKK